METVAPVLAKLKQDSPAMTQSTLQTAPQYAEMLLSTPQKLVMTITTTLAMAAALLV